MMQHGTVANELERPQRCESGNRVCIGTPPAFRQASGDADHVLLRYPDINKAVREPGAKRLHHHVSEIAGEQDYTFVSRRKATQRINEGFSQLAASNSRIAISYSRSLIGR